MVTFIKKYTLNQLRFILQCILIEDKNVGIIGTGLIGKKTVQKIAGLCNKVLCYDAYPAADWIKTIPNAEYVSLDELFAESHVISIHVPLLPETHHLINKVIFHFITKYPISLKATVYRNFHVDMNEGMCSDISSI